MQFPPPRVSTVHLLILSEYFSNVAKLALTRANSILPSVIIMLWRNSTLELFRYLDYKKL